MKYLFIITAFTVSLISPPLFSSSYAQDHHDHAPEKNRSEHSDTQQDLHDAHEGESEAHNDDHGAHEGEAGAHDDEHDEHEEGNAEITPESAKRMGVIVEKAGSAIIDKTVPLMGRITLNQNTKADIRARFSGIVRDVKVNLGDHVKKGQVLAVIEANDSLRDYNVTSPISGVVLERGTNTGDVAGDQRLFMIADLSNVWAKFHVFPRDSESINSGQTIRIHTLEDDTSQNGRIDMLFPTADELSQTQIAIVVLGNKERIWKPGMTIEADVTVSQERAMVTVTETALQKMEEFGDVIFIQNGQSYEPRPVVIGVKANGLVEVIDGIESGETYVSKGSFIIKSDILKSTAEHSH